MDEPLNSDKTPTDVIIEVMEKVDQIEHIIVFYRFKKPDDSTVGMGWHTNVTSTTMKIGLLEEAKMCIFGNAYLPQDGD